MQRADEIVMAVLLLVVDRRAPLHDILQRHRVENLPRARRAPDFFSERERGAAVAVGHANQRSARLFVEWQLLALDRFGAVEQFCNGRRVERFENQDTRARQQRRNQFE